MEVISAIGVAIVAWVFTRILIQDGMIFDSWWKILNKLPNWLQKPLGACEYCFGGQLGLYYYIYAYYASYSLISHILYVSIVIFTIKVINTVFYGNEGDTP